MKFREPFGVEPPRKAMDARKAACGTLLKTFRTQHFHDNVLFKDECSIYLSMHSWNIVFWGKENPFFYEVVERNPPHAMV
ncbi:hypothetical protein ANN_26565 [Periplaneta americana]|uniref:Uncharacterized protein n=1 Tax=Periplaneta americana TaxID=6978 RepID=A0ABQ8RYL2_PERAM|nr:hypothetical protein ANN_26565 [Periplaneta americana]